MTLPLLWVSLAFLSGIALKSLLTRAPLDIWLIITLTPIIVAMILHQKSRTLGIA